MRFPSYDDLPRTSDGARSGWSCFPPDDSIGRLALQTPDRVAEAARLVHRGVIFALNAELGAFDPPLLGRTATHHRVIRFPGDPGFDDVLDDFNPQTSSQWDALGHAAYSSDVFFNGTTVRDVLENGRNTIDHWARRGIAGRGVLLDLEPILLERCEQYTPDQPIAISVDDLETARAAAGVEYEPGDILLLHTGFFTWYSQQGAHRKAELATEDGLTAAGLEHSESMARYLWDSQAAAIASDNPSVEAWPPDLSDSAGPFGRMHRHLIGQFGMALGELWDLTDLVADCRADGVAIMLITSAPLNVAGGLSSPANALAIK